MGEAHFINRNGKVKNHALENDFMFGDLEMPRFKTMSLARVRFFIFSSTRDGTPISMFMMYNVSQYRLTFC